MAHFKIVGSADCPLFALAERIADTMQRSLPVTDISIEIVHPTEWDDRLERARNELGFSLVDSTSHFVYNPITKKLIGDADDFAEQVRKKYGIEVAVTDEELSVIAEQNLEMMEQRLKQATEAQSV